MAWQTIPGIKAPSHIHWRFQQPPSTMKISWLWWYGPKLADWANYNILYVTQRIKTPSSQQLGTQRETMTCALWAIIYDPIYGTTHDLNEILTTGGNDEWWVLLKSKSISRGFRTQYIPVWDEQCELLYNDFQETSNSDTADEHISALDSSRRREWEKTVSNVDFQHSSRKAWGLLRKLGSSIPITRAGHIVQKLRAPADKEHFKLVNKELTQLTT